MVRYGECGDGKCIEDLTCVSDRRLTRLREPPKYPHRSSLSLRKLGEGLAAGGGVNRKCLLSNLQMI
jgi:hypothetical protein